MFFSPRYLSSIAAVLLTLKLGSLHSQRAALLCPLFYHAIVALCQYFSTVFSTICLNFIFNCATQSPLLHLWNTISLHIDISLLGIFIKQGFLSENYVFSSPDLGFSPTQMFNPAILTNGLVSLLLEYVVVTSLF